MGEPTAINNAYGNSTFGYDPFGRRIWAQMGSGVKTFFVYDGDMLLGELRQTDNGVNTVYTWGAAGLVSERVVSAAKTLWYHYGPQGETRHLTSSAGLIVDTYTYSAYGVPVNGGSTGNDPNPFRYGGQVGYYTGTNQGAYMNLIRCGTRWYDPEIGRWINRDPIGYSGGPNLFEYCGGNPVKYLDPRGMDLRDDINSLWRVPTNIVGLALSLGGEPRTTPGQGNAIIVQGGLGASLIRLTNTPAITIGDVVIFNKKFEPNGEVCRHELGHVQQHASLGPLYVPAHVFAYAGGFLFNPTGNLHDNSVFEIDADVRSGMAQQNQTVREWQHGETFWQQGWGWLRRHIHL